MAGPTGIEPATSGVTGRRSNHLNYDPAQEKNLTLYYWIVNGSGFLTSRLSM